MGININSILGNGSLDKDVLFSQILSPGGVDLGKRLFTNFGIDYQQYYKSDVNSYDLFLVWEPLGSITYKNNAYIGTAHELLTFVDGVPGKFGSGEWSAYQYVSNNLTAGMGCAVNLENSDTFGNKVATKFGTAFSSRSYFGGRLDASEAGTIASYCAPENHSKVTGSKYKPYVLNNDKGFTSPFAIGILWFDDIGNGTPSLSCADVDNYYSGVNICNEIITKGDFNFKEFNYVNAGKKFPVGAENGITKDWYVSNCCGSGDGIDCTPLYNVPSCTEGSNQTLTYKDSSDWEHCIFTDKNNGKNNIYTINPHKWANKLQTLSYYDKNLSSDFCDVYCIEEVYGNFDSNNPTVLAGNHFVWGWSTVRTTRTCRTYKIEWDMFTDALTSANQDVLQEQAEEYLEELNASGYWEKGDERMKDGDICEDGYEDGPCKENNPDGTCKTHEQVCKGWNQVHDCWEYEWKNGRSSATVYGDVDSDGRLESATAYADSFDRCQDTEPSNPASGGNVSYAIDQVMKK